MRQAAHGEHAVRLHRGVADERGRKVKVIARAASATPLQPDAATVRGGGDAAAAGGRGDILPTGAQGTHGKLAQRNHQGLCHLVRAMWAVIIDADGKGRIAHAAITVRDLNVHREGHIILLCRRGMAYRLQQGHGVGRRAGSYRVQGHRKHLTARNHGVLATDEADQCTAADIPECVHCLSIVGQQWRGTTGC